MTKRVVVVGGDSVTTGSAEGAGLGRTDGLRWCGTGSRPATSRSTRRYQPRAAATMSRQARTAVRHMASCPRRWSPQDDDLDVVFWRRKRLGGPREKIGSRGAGDFRGDEGDGTESEAVGDRPTVAVLVGADTAVGAARGARRAA